MGIFEICIPEKTAKCLHRQSLPTACLGYFFLLRRPRGAKQAGRQIGQPAGRLKEPFLFLSQQRRAPAGPACLVPNKQYQEPAGAIISPHPTPSSAAQQGPKNCSRAARHGSGVALAFACAVSPKSSMGFFVAWQHGGAANVASSSLVSSFFFTTLVALASQPAECLIQSRVEK